MPFISEAKARGFASAVAFGPWASLYERKTDVKRQIFVRFAPIAAMPRSRVGWQVCFGSVHCTRAHACTVIVFFGLQVNRRR
jgi:hypothetical protein